jgi:hypothetical protein
MTISAIHSLKPGDTFKYKGKTVTVLWVRPPYPDDVISIDGKWINFPDKSVCISFKLADDSIVCLSSMLNSVMIKDKKMVALDLQDYQK